MRFVNSKAVTPFTIFASLCALKLPEPLQLAASQEHHNHNDEKKAATANIVEAGGQHGHE
jgi:hypothetical protein